MEREILRRIEALEVGAGKEVEAKQRIVDWTKVEENLKDLEVGDICYFGIEEMSKRDDSKINLLPEDSTIVTQLLKLVGGKRVKDAMELLDSAKNIILECTVVHEKYKY